MQALGMALVPPKPASQKELSHRARDRCRIQFVARPASQVGAIAQRSQSGRASPGRMA
jgi:hypothetical protein